MFEDVKIYEAPTWHVIGDIHGCHEEHLDLYNQIPNKDGIAYVGDFVDRGPKSMDVLIFLAMIESPTVRLVSGNHDNKFSRYLQGRNIVPSHGLETTIEEYKKLRSEAQFVISSLVQRLPYYVVLRNTSDGKITIVVHAAIKPWMIGAPGKQNTVRSLCLYGQTTGERTSQGFPVRLSEWCSEWDDLDVTVVYGHTPVKDVKWIGHTVNIDTGCVFGGKLTAFNTSTHDVIQVNARETYADGELR